MMARRMMSSSRSSGSTMTVTIDGTQVAQTSGSNNSLDMTFDQLGTGYGTTSPDAPTSGYFPFTGTISSLTITQGTALAGSVAPSSSSVNQITFTPPAAGTYTVGLSSTNSSGSEHQHQPDARRHRRRPHADDQRFARQRCGEPDVHAGRLGHRPGPVEHRRRLQRCLERQRGPESAGRRRVEPGLQRQQPDRPPLGPDPRRHQPEDQRDLPDHRRRRHPRLPGRSRWARHRETTCRSSTSAPTAISALSSITAPSQPIEQHHAAQ